jgi:excisionase family DNA binding protein
MKQYEIFSDNHGKSVHSKIRGMSKNSTATKSLLNDDSDPIFDLIITAREAAELLNVTYRQVFTLIREHGLPAHNMGRRVYLSVKEIFNWFYQQPYVPKSKQKRKAKKYNLKKITNSLFKY